MATAKRSTATKAATAKKAAGPKAATATKKAAGPKATTAKKPATSKASATKKAATPTRTTAKKPATTKSATPKAAPQRTSSLAAGAARASGERARRRSTPLLSTSPADATSVRATPSAGSAPSAAKAAAAPPLAGATPSAGAAPPRAAHRPSPTGRGTASSKATRQAGIRPQSPRAKRAADEAARRHLRVAAVPDPTPAPAPVRVTRTPSPDPTATQTDMALPVPGVEELLSASISAMRIAAQGAGVSPEEIERRIASALAFLRRRIEGDYSVDEFGYDEHFAENIIFPLLRPIYRSWFRVEVRGLENIPAEGGALIVSNHSGTVALDSLMVAQALHDEHPQHRIMRALGADLVFQTPFLGTVARRGGSTLAAQTDVERLFAKGELVGVFPEGFKGVGKPFRERYKLQRFGRGGFVSAALSAGVPIIPTSVVGAEETFPILGNMKTVARLLGLPYAPITPTFPLLGPLGLIPLPSKWIIEFGAPIETASHGPGAADDPMLVFDLTDQVRETIQQTLYSLLMQRRSVFF